jgi:hypothetical protein
MLFINAPRQHNRILPKLLVDQLISLERMGESSTFTLQTDEGEVLFVPRSFT